MNILLLLAALLLFPLPAGAEEPPLDRPHWSLELKTGSFYPDIENWRQYYDSEKTGHVAVAVAYKLFRQGEIGIEGGYMKDRGRGYAPLHNMLMGSVLYELFPLHVYGLVRGVFNEGQWIVPYAGGGWTRLHYREEIEYQPTVRGVVNGYHARAGIQLLLDKLDPDAATGLLLDYGIDHTCLFVEAQSLTAETTTADGVSIDLGGVSYFAGLLFEF